MLSSAPASSTLDSVSVTLRQPNGVPMHESSSTSRSPSASLSATMNMAPMISPSSAGLLMPLRIIFDSTGPLVSCRSSDQRSRSTTRCEPSSTSSKLTGATERLNRQL